MLLKFHHTLSLPGYRLHCANPLNEDWSGFGFTLWVWSFFVIRPYQLHHYLHINVPT